MRPTLPKLVGSLLYLASWTHPNIACTVVALAQWNASPTKSTLLAAKGVLCYLLGTRDWILKYGDGVRTDSIADWHRIGPEAIHLANSAKFEIELERIVAQL